MGESLERRCFLRRALGEIRDCLPIIIPAAVGAAAGVIMYHNGGTGAECAGCGILWGIISVPAVIAAYGNKDGF